jgi:hypothetical protein
MSVMDDMHDDEVRAKLGLAPLGRAMTVEERITMLNLQAMPEPHDDAEVVDLAVVDALAPRAEHLCDWRPGDVPIPPSQCRACAELVD